MATKIMQLFRSKAGKRASHRSTAPLKGYILIKCYQPKKNGEMQVEMNYEGDKHVIEYLLKSALNQLDT